MRCVLYIYILFGRESSVHTVVPVGNTIVNDEACWRPDSVAVSWYVPLLESHACCTGHNKAWPLAHSIDLSSWKSSLLVRGYTFVSCSVQCSLSSKLSFAMQSKVIFCKFSQIKVFVRACEFWQIKCHALKREKIEYNIRYILIISFMSEESYFRDRGKRWPIYGHAQLSAFEPLGWCYETKVDIHTTRIFQLSKLRWSKLS